MKVSLKLDAVVLCAAARCGAAGAADPLEAFEACLFKDRAQPRDVAKEPVEERDGSFESHRRSTRLN